MAAFRPKLVRAYESETLSSTQAGEAGPRNTPEPPHPWTAKGTITKCYDRMAIGPKSQEEGSRIEKKKKKEKKKKLPYSLLSNHTQYPSIRCPLPAMLPYYYVGAIHTPSKTEGLGVAPRL